MGIKIELLGEVDQSFSEKRNLGVESSGHLQFHLNKLEPLLVGQTSDGKNYAPTQEGRESLRLITQVAWLPNFALPLAFELTIMGLGTVLISKARSDLISVGLAAFALLVARAVSGVGETVSTDATVFGIVSPIGSYQAYSPPSYSILFLAPDLHISSELFVPSTPRPLTASTH